MKNNRILTESEKKEILNNKEQLIIESFREEFNKIKRIDENELKEEDGANAKSNKPYER
jgi:glutathionyl-hydroquinone reductase